MTTYKQIIDFRNGTVCAIEILGANTSFPLVIDNTDYQTFKAQINADEAQLEDADGIKLTVKKAKAFVATLP